MSNKLHAISRKKCDLKWNNPTGILKK